jgi:hypothetical protein
MTPDWAKNLLVKIALGAVVLFAFLVFTGTAGASDIAVNPSSISVSFSFDQPKEIAHYETQRTVTIQNTNPDPNSTTSGFIDSISGDISITPSDNSFILQGGESSSVTLTIVAAPTASEGTHEFSIGVGEESITVRVTITYYARIEVSPSSIDFGRVHRTDNPLETVRFRETYGYKNVTINLLRSGNSWVTGPTSILVPAGGHHDVTFLLTPGTPNRNDYSWTFSLSSPTSHTTLTPSSIHLEAYILMPPKLGRLQDEGLELKFDKPKGTVSEYERDIEVRVRNDGDETLFFTSKFTESPSGITIGIVNPSGSVSGKSSKDIKLRIVAPFDAREGTYRGRLDITTAGNAGSGSVDITIAILWPVDFSISHTSIDFGSIELKEQRYEKKSENIILTEFFLYKPVQNLRITKSGEYRNWLKEELDFAEIPPGESRTITLTIEPGLEAVPQDYLWRYDIRALETGTKRIEVKAKIVPLNISQTIEDFKSFRGTPLYRDYPSSESIISDGIEILEVIEESEVSAEDWQKIPVLMKGTLSLLSSLNGGIVSGGEENYGEAVESLVAASVSSSTIESHSNLNNRDISRFATDMSVGADTTTEEVLLDAAKLLELRGWTIKKAVEHALAVDNISGLTEGENVLESAISYQHAATLYGLLNDQEKRLENVHEESLLMDKHDVLVSDATELRITTETTIATSKENDLMKIWDMHLLLNPYNYDTFSQSYKTAESDLEDASEKYKVAGELLLADTTQEVLTELKGEMRFILSLFIIACILYSVLFIYAIFRIIGGTMAYLRDMHEREVGDILVT